MVIGANPTDAHPVFASRMKRRLREGARLIVVDPRRIDLVKHAARRGRLSPAAAARHQRRGDQRAGACRSSPRAWSTRPSSPSAASRTTSSAGATSSREPENSPEAMEQSPACRRPDVRAAARLYATGGNARDLLRPRRHRAQPGLDHGDGHGEPRHGDRQHRPRRRRREPAARPEQRAGLLRHGLLPARVLRLPPRLRRRDARSCSRQAWGVGARGRAGPAHPQHARRRGRRHASRASTSRARTSRSPTPTRSTSPPASRRWNASSCRTSS